MTHEELIVCTQQNDARSRSNMHRIDRLEERQDAMDKLVASVAEIATKQNTMETDIADIKTNLNKIAGKSGARWDAVVDKVLLGIVAAIVGYIMIHIGF